MLASKKDFRSSIPKGHNLIIKYKGIMYFVSISSNWDADGAGKTKVGQFQVTLAIN